MILTLEELVYILDCLQEMPFAPSNNVDIKVLEEKLNKEIKLIGENNGNN